MMSYSLDPLLENHQKLINSTYYKFTPFGEIINRHIEIVTARVFTDKQTNIQIDILVK